MELILITAVLCISLSLLQTPCTSLQLPVQSSLDQKGSLANDEFQYSPSTLPRKLRFTSEVTVKEHGDPGTMSYKNEDLEPVSGKQYIKEEEVMHGSKGTWQEWVEGTDTSQYFTMDYSHVKRRRPIHNKSLPVGP